MEDQLLKVDEQSDVPLQWGNCTRKTVLGDFDNTPLNEVKFHSYLTCKKYKLKGFIILRSSSETHTLKQDKRVLARLTNANYHVVFDRPVECEDNVQIMNWMALEFRNFNLASYVRMQRIKKSSTLRISGKEGKPIPKIVFRYGTCNLELDIGCTSNDCLARKHLDCAIFRLNNGLEVDDLQL